jgi:hypothetical protein
VAALALLAAVAAAAQAPNPRGELLYSTYCAACHGAQMHWRDKKVATSWPTLLAQVRRWQMNVGVAWTEDDVVSVARYLNARFYRFPEPDGRQISLARPR